MKPLSDVVPGPSPLERGWGEVKAKTIKFYN